MVANCKSNEGRYFRKFTAYAYDSRLELPLWRACVLIQPPLRRASVLFICLTFKLSVQHPIHNRPAVPFTASADKRFIKRVSVVQINGIGYSTSINLLFTLIPFLDVILTNAAFRARVLIDFAINLA